MEDFFDKSLSNVYDEITEADYYAMFFDSIFHYLSSEEILKKTISI